MIGKTPIECDDWEMTNQEIGSRVREVIAGRQQQDVAAAIDMAPDAFSRSLNGKRAFSTLELVRVADLVGADVHWLITGERDPMAMHLAARHVTDPVSFARSVPGEQDDAPVLRDIALAYRKVYEEPVEPAPLPATPDGVRQALGADFVRDFADRIEARLGVDVVRIGEVSTDYSLTIGGRRIIVLKAGPHWYRENFGLAHELAHLCLGHLGDEATKQQEEAANAFAAELLLPAEDVRAVDWAAATPMDLAAFLWRAGISTKALATRLKTLHLPPKRDLAQGTEQLLRNGNAELDPHLSVRAAITKRSGDAAERRFPAHLQEAHREGIAGGSVFPGALAWMLAVDPATFDDDLPDRPEIRAAQADTMAELDAFFGIE